MHGPALFNAFFMPRRASVVELRPRGFGGAWPDSYLKVCFLLFFGGRGEGGYVFVGREEVLLSES